MTHRDETKRDSLGNGGVVSLGANPSATQSGSDPAHPLAPAYFWSSVSEGEARERAGGRRHVACFFSLRDPMPEGLEGV